MDKPLRKSLGSLLQIGSVLILLLSLGGCGGSGRPALFLITSAAITTASISLVKSNGVQLAPQTTPPTCNADNAGLLVLKQSAGPTFTFCACTGANYINIVSGAACP